MRAWIFQDHKQKQLLGDKCPWSVGFYDASGKRRSKRIGSRSLAEKESRRIEGQLIAGTYEAPARSTWEQFMAEYESKILAVAEPATREATQYAINHFERIIRPVKMRGITSKVFADYVAARRQEPRNPKAKEPDKQPRVSPATVNKELRALRAMAKRAFRWKYITEVPEIEFLKEHQKLATYIPPEHFTALYQACDHAKRPAGGTIRPGEWWRALLIVAYMTGWRIGQILALEWSQVDLDEGTILSLAKDNKGKRDQLLAVHPMVLDHLQAIRGFHVSVFPLEVDRRAIYTEFKRIQATAGVKPPGKRLYGFHDFRRAFATMNADRMTGDALQALMQHKDYKTTQGYINMARQLKPAVAELFVPELKGASGAG